MLWSISICKQGVSLACLHDDHCERLGQWPLWYVIVSHEGRSSFIAISDEMSKIMTTLGPIVSLDH